VLVGNWEGHGVRETKLVWHDSRLGHIGVESLVRVHLSIIRHLCFLNYLLLN
jgi:hypothetical protein